MIFLVVVFDLVGEVGKGRRWNGGVGLVFIIIGSM